MAKELAPNGDIGDVGLEPQEERAIFAALEQLRAEGGATAGVRLFRTRAGDFVRLLDTHAAPLSPGAVRCACVAVIALACWLLLLLK